MRNCLRPVFFSLYFCFAVACAASLQGCYSFTGASVPTYWKTIAIPLFDDESNYGQPSLRETITNTLIQKFQRDNTLALSDRSSASIEMRGKIVSVDADQPIAVAQGTQASRLQVTLRVAVTLIDNIRKKDVWSKTLTASGDYAPSGGLSERQNGLQKAIDKLTDDLLLETVSAW